MNARHVLIMLASCAALFTGCQATCDSACTKIIETCEGGIPSYSTAQCALDCNAVQTQYEAHDYLQPQLDAFQAQLNCIRDADCADLTDPESPACYDDQLFVF